MITCSGCPKTWTGLRIAHCGACHETFSTVAVFDLHRSGRGLHGACKHPGALRIRSEGKDTREPLLKLSDRGVWTKATTDPRWST